MSTFKRFEEIEAWQSARLLTRNIYQLSKGGEFSKDYSFRDQIRRAGVSTMANIAEGFDREGNGEFMQFLSVAKASCAEFRSHLYVALDVDYISKDEFQKLYHDADKTSKMIGGLMNYLITSDLKGSKFYKRKTTKVTIPKPSNS